jgi:MFS transporter, putative metabolite:H+ symporter
MLSASSPLGLRRAFAPGVFCARSARSDRAHRAEFPIEARVQREYDRPLPAPPPPIPESAAAFGKMFEHPYLTRVAMLLVANLFQAIGYYGFNNWVPMLLMLKGMPLTNSLWDSFLIATASPLAPLLVMTIVDKFERKWLIVGASIALAGCGMIFSVLAAPTAIVLFGILITISNQLMAVISHAYQTEVFPTRSGVVPPGSSIRSAESALGCLDF